jgi:hypothetical protein
MVHWVGEVGKRKGRKEGRLILLSLASKFLAIAL